MQDFIKVIEKIDWDLLHDQKQELLQIIWEKDNDKIEGLVNLLDDLQDVASKLRVWTFPTEEERCCWCDQNPCKCHEHENIADTKEKE